MSETVTIGTASAIIYGTLAEATDYLALMTGDGYDAWRALDDDGKKRSLVTATRYLDRQSWIDAAGSFALRDAMPVFHRACYELAAMVAEDASIVTVADQGGNIQTIGAGGAGITYFHPTSSRFGSASVLPPILMALVGDYLASTGNSGPQGGTSRSGSCVNPFSDRADFDRTDVW